LDEWLAVTAARARQKTGRHLDRSAIVRALIEAVAGAHLDLTECTTEIQIHNAVAERLRATRGEPAEAR
jgi:hypothetical protein